jgi:hypothetical protein
MTQMHDTPRRQLIGWRPTRPQIPTETEDQYRDRCAAVLNRLSREAVLAGPTAARLHGVWAPQANLIHVIVPAPDRHGDLVWASRRPDVTTRRVALDPSVITRVDHLPVIAPATTWIDVAATVNGLDLLAVGDQLLAKQLVTTDELAVAIRMSFGRAGVRRARLVEPHLSSRALSVPESHLRGVLTFGDVPGLAVNGAVYDQAEQWIGVPDLGLLECRIGIEYHGAVHAEPEQMRKDYTRQMDFRRGGWELLVFTADPLYYRPDSIVADVRQVIGERSSKLGSRRVIGERFAPQ